jgi:hypothetical protein
MRKLIVVFLFFAGTVNHLSAQVYRGVGYTSTAAEGTFDNPKPGKTKVKFYFYRTYASANIQLELSSIKQMAFVPNLDSILLVGKNAIIPLADSLKQDGFVRRVDVFSNEKGTQIRIVNYNSRPSTFIAKEGELSYLKMDQDTLRIKFFVKTGEKFINPNKQLKLPSNDIYAPAFITVLVNNFDDLKQLPDTIMQRCLSLVNQDITPEFIRKAKSVESYSASYNISIGKREFPSKPRWLRSGSRRNELVPNIYGSLQFVRGDLSPSMAAGARFSVIRSNTQTTRFYLMWEPYFFFNRDSNNKLRTDRNDFITFRYIEEEESDRKNGGFNFIGNVSFGYLFNRRGEWFEKNTFKVGLPGVRSGWLQLEPEFYFNNFLKNFSPTLKLTLHYE